MRDQGSESLSDLPEVGRMKSQESTWVAMSLYSGSLCEGEPMPPTTVVLRNSKGSWISPGHKSNLSQAVKGTVFLFFKTIVNTLKVSGVPQGVSDFHVSVRGAALRGKIS